MLDQRDGPRHGRECEQRQGPAAPRPADGGERGRGAEQMIGNRLGAFIESMLGDRRPKSFGASPEDAAVLRVAIALRAGRPGEGGPDQEFIAGLHRELAEQAGDLSVVEDQARPRQSARASTARGVRPSRPRRVLLSAAAAAVVLVGGTVVATNALEQPSRTTTPQAALGAAVRFA